MGYYLAEIRIPKLKTFYVLVKAENYDEAKKIAEREYSIEDYRVNIQITLE